MDDQTPDPLDEFCGKCKAVPGHPCRDVEPPYRSMASFHPGRVRKAIGRAKKAKPARKVIIRHDPEKHMYFVRYLEHRYGTRYCAAQFDDRHSTPEEVEQWVRANPKLELVTVDNPERFYVGTRV